MAAKHIHLESFSEITFSSVKYFLWRSRGNVFKASDRLLNVKVIKSLEKSNHKEILGYFNWSLIWEGKEDLATTEAILRFKENTAQESSEASEHENLIGKWRTLSRNQLLYSWRWSEPLGVRRFHGSRESGLSERSTEYFVVVFSLFDLGSSSAFFI